MVLRCPGNPCLAPQVRPSESFIVAPVSDRRLNSRGRETGHWPGVAGPTPGSIPAGGSDVGGRASHVTAAHGDRPLTATGGSQRQARHAEMPSGAASRVTAHTAGITVRMVATEV